MCFHISDIVQRNRETIARAMRERWNLGTLGRGLADVCRECSSFVEFEWVPQRAPKNILAMCATALRGSRESEDQNAADILELAIVESKYINDPDDNGEEFYQLAQTIIHRNPGLGAAYRSYATAAPDPFEGLRAANRGLRCADVTPAIRRDLLYLAVRNTMRITLSHCASYLPCDPTISNRTIVFLQRALEDACSFLNEAPLDHNAMMEMVNWTIELMVILRGHDLSELELHVSINW